MGNLSDTVQIHDKYHFEMKFTYPLDRERASTSYNVETFMFIQNNLCVNSGTYAKEDFFNDMQKHIRFKTPAVLLRVLDQGDSSPLAKLAGTMRRLAEKGGKEAERDYEERLKMLCSILKSAMRDEEAFIESSKDDPNFKELVENYIRLAQQVVFKFRALKMIVQAPTVDPRLLKLFKFADEFISLTECKHLTALALFLKSLGSERDMELHAMALNAIKEEILHREGNAYSSVPRHGSGNEEYLHREGVLKKIMSSVLFLRTNTKKEGRLLEQALFGLAAGLAMAFATIVAFFSRTVIAMQDFSLSFFSILVVAYMFKDRLKELLRGYLSEKLRGHLYDYRTEIFNDLGRKVGVCKESFSFIPESKLPKEIAQLKAKDYFSELESGCLGESVIHARKSIKLFSKGSERIFSDFKVDGVVDIMRFDVRAFLEKMDNPTRVIHMPSEEGIVETRGRRVYHVNMVLKYGMEGGDCIFRLFRLILARNGIKSIECCDIDPARPNPS